MISNCVFLCQTKGDKKYSQCNYIFLYMHHPSYLMLCPMRTNKICHKRSHNIFSTNLLKRTFSVYVLGLENKVQFSKISSLKVEMKWFLQWSSQSEELKINGPWISKITSLLQVILCPIKHCWWKWINGLYSKGAATRILNYNTTLAIVEYWLVVLVVPW